MVSLAAVTTGHSPGPAMARVFGGLRRPFVSRSSRVTGTATVLSPNRSDSCRVTASRPLVPPVPTVADCFRLMLARFSLVGSNVTFVSGRSESRVPSPSTLPPQVVPTPVGVDTPAPAPFVPASKTAALPVGSNVTFAQNRNGERSTCFLRWNSRLGAFEAVSFR